MKIEPLGDSAIIVREIGHPAHKFADAVRAAQLPGVTEAMASYDTVGVYFDSAIFNPSALLNLTVDRPAEIGTLHEIPVCYEFGEDMADVSAQLGLKTHEVIEMHTAQPFTCFALGFCPGFAYLGLLPDRLSGMPRRAAPRVRVEPGSVAITGRQTAVYPLTRPGGWSIIGKTPLCLVDVEDAYFPIKAGDQVRFVPISPDEFNARMGDRL
jgi:inhibitor of KinA